MMSQTAYYEEAHYQMMARYDDVRERYAAELRDLELEDQERMDSYFQDGIDWEEEAHWVMVLSDPRANNPRGR